MIWERLYGKKVHMFTSLYKQTLFKVTYPPHYMWYSFMLYELSKME